MKEGWEEAPVGVDYTGTVSILQASLGDGWPFPIDLAH